jgi:hypothetical protein
LYESGDLPLSSRGLRLRERVVRRHSSGRWNCLEVRLARHELPVDNRRLGNLPIGRHNMRLWLLLQADDRVQRCRNLANRVTQQLSALEGRCLSADPFAIPLPGVVAVQKVRLLAPATASLGFGRNTPTFYARPINGLRAGGYGVWRGSGAP